MAGPRRLTSLVSSALARLELPDGNVVVALSGGADSAALAYLTLVAGRRPRLLHVDHGLDHSPLMRRAAADVAADLGLDLDIAQVVVERGPSPEGQARMARYQALETATAPDERVFTGHTADDNVETVLLNLIRGTGPTGLGGIPFFRPPKVYRPILKLSRAEAREIAAIAGLRFVDDPMNQDPTLTRNLIRQEIVPSLTAINPSIVEAIDRMSRLVGQDDSYLSDRAGRIRPELTDGSASVPVGSLLAAPRPVADRVLRRMAGHVAGEDRVDAAALERVWSVVRGESPRQEIARGATASRAGPALVMTSDLGPVIPFPLDLAPGRVAVGDLVFEILARKGPCLVAPLSRWSAIFPAGTSLTLTGEGMVLADGEPAWEPGERRLPVAWYQPGESGYLVVSASRKPGWTSSP